MFSPIFILTKVQVQVSKQKPNINKCDGKCLKKYQVSQIRKKRTHFLISIDKSIISFNCLLTMQCNKTDNNNKNNEIICKNKQRKSRVILFLLLLLLLLPFATHKAALPRRRPSAR